MKSLQWMDIIYPLDAGLIAGLLVVKISYMFIVRSSASMLSAQVVHLIRWVIGFDCMFILTELSVFILLGLSTGVDPTFSIDEYRRYVVIARAAMGLVLAGCITVHVIVIDEYVGAKLLSRIDKFLRGVVFSVQKNFRT